MNVDPELSVDLERFFALSLDHLVVAGFDGYFKRLSPAWLTTFGWSLEEFFARPVIAFVHPDDRAAVLASRARLIDGVPLTGLLNRYQCKDGRYRWMEWKSVSSAERRVVYGVARDVTVQREAEEQRQRVQAQLAISERMASVGRLAAGVAHEINNPLAFILANLRTVMAQLQLPEGAEDMPRAELQEILGETLDGADRVRRIVAALQSYAAPDRGLHSRVRLQPIVEQALTLVGSNLRQAARLIETHAETPEVEVDPSQLEKVVVNLLLNALSARSPEAAAPHEIRIETFTDSEGRACLEVADTGSGISAAALARVFEPFFTTREPGEGVGLGLSVCHTLVGAMGGTISVIPGSRQGTTLRVVLPPAPSSRG
jgi:two-component system NtrC family sensor kinase